MLRMDNSNISFSGRCEVNDVVVGSFSAGFSGADVYINVNIVSKALHDANEEAFNTDLIAFKDHVMTVIESM